MNCPNTFTAEQIKAWNVSSSSDGKRWIPARPCGWQGIALRLRLKAAWRVFTGRADVLTWEPKP